MSSINDFLNPPAAITITFTGVNLASFNVAFSGSLNRLSPLGFGIAKVPGDSYKITIPVLKDDGTFSSVITTQSIMSELEREIQNIIIPQLSADWVSATSPANEDEGDPDVDTDPPPAAQ